MATMPRTYDDDPFSGEMVPSLSFRDAPQGTRYVGTIVKRARLQQQRDFESGQPAHWDDGNPKMAAVIELDINGEVFGLWAPKPSAMFAALVQAQRDANAGTMVEGGVLAVEFIGTEPNRKNPKLNAQKLYRCQYTPPAVQDPLETDAEQQSRQAAQPPRPSRPQPTPAHPQQPAQPPRPAGRRF